MEDKVGSSGYRSASELLRAALRLLLREKEQDALKLGLLRQEITRGLEDAEAGRFSTKSLDDIADAASGDDVYDIAAQVSALPPV